MLKVKNLIEESLDSDLPDSYNSDIFSAKANLVLSLFIDKAVQGLL